MSKSREPVVGLSPPRHDYPEGLHHLLSHQLANVDESIADLQKDVAKAIAEDRRIYRTPQENRIQACASRVLYQLVGAREAIADMRALGG